MDGNHTKTSRMQSTSLLPPSLPPSLFPSLPLNSLRPSLPLSTSGGSTTAIVEKGAVAAAALPLAAKLLWQHRGDSSSAVFSRRTACYSMALARSTMASCSRCQMSVTLPLGQMERANMVLLLGEDTFRKSQ